jgi:hypothetical protein
MGWVWATLGGIVAVTTGKVAGDLVSKEIEGRLDRIPQVLLRLARRRLPPELRVPLHDEWWLPDLQERLRRNDSRPLTRLFTGVRFAIGLALTAPRTARAAAPATRRHPVLRAWRAPAATALCAAVISVRYARFLKRVFHRPVR